MKDLSRLDIPKKQQKKIPKNYKNLQALKRKK